LFVQGAAPGDSNLVAVRAFGTGLWYWLNLDAKVLHAFPLKLGPDDGPIAISPDGKLVAVSRPDHGPLIQPINVAVPVASSSPVPGDASPPTVTPTPTSSPLPPAKPRAVNSKLAHADGLAWSPDASLLVLTVNGRIQIYAAAGKDGTAPLKTYLTGVSGVDWSGAIHGQSHASVKRVAGPQAAVDALLKVTKLPAAADKASVRYLTKVYLWQYDSSKISPIATIADATPALLEQYPPMSTDVVFHHWVPSATWALIGECNRYRVVIKGSIPARAFTFGLGTNTPCNTTKASP
jgi:hypothetical protein